MCDVPLPKKFQFVGASLPLDFTNTVGGKRGVKTREYLSCYQDFLSWCRQANLVDAAQEDRLARVSVERPEEALEALGRARELREAIFSIFAAVMAGKPPENADLECLNRELSQALCRRRVAARGDGFRWEWVATGDGLGNPLGPVAGAAADLLTDPAALSHLRQCEGDGCGWLFLDSSKNHSRRWCDMRDCGNRAKVRRHRLRHRMR